MTLLACEYCGKRFNGKVALYDHKLQSEPRWRREAKKYFDLQIKILETEARE